MTRSDMTRSTMTLAARRLPEALDPVSAARRVAPAIAARAKDLDRDGARPLDDVAALAEAGLLAGPLPRSLGGAGLGEGADGAIALADVLRLVGHANLAVGRLYEGHVNALQLIARYGHAGQQAAFAAEARAGCLFGVWNTQAAGSGLEIGPDLRLSGGKTFASGAGFVARPLVTAKRPDGETVMVIPRLDDPARADLSDWHPHGMRASATGTVDFTGLVVRPDEVLGEPGDYHGQPTFSAGAWRFLAVQAGGIEAVLDAARAHLVATGRDGDPHQRARIGEATIAAESARLWIERAALVATRAEDDPDRAVAYVNLARLAVERAGLDVLERVHRTVGLQGFLADHPLERLTRDLATYLRQPAPDRALTEGAAHVLGRPEAAGDLWRPL